MRSFHWHHDTELAEFSETHAWERGWIVVRARKCRVFQRHQGVGGVFGDMGQWVGRVCPQNQFAPTFVITYFLDFCMFTVLSSHIVWHGAGLIRCCFDVMSFSRHF